MSLLGSIELREDPVLGHNFVIALLDPGSALAMSSSDAVQAVNQSAAAGFSECSGLEMTLDIEDFKEGGQCSHVLKFPTRVTWSNLTLKRGVTASTELWDWFYGFVEGRGTRRDGLIVLRDSEGMPHTIWTFQRGLPAKYTGPALNAGQNAVAIETLEIAHEGLAILPNE